MGTRTRYTLILLLLFYTLTGWAQNIRVTSLTATTGLTNLGAFKMTNGASNLRVLTSDANGNATWQPPGSVTDTNAWARLNGLGTNGQANGFTITAGGFTNLVATTNAGPVNNAAAVTNYSTVQNKGGVTNASWVRTAGAVTNDSTLRQIGAATFAGALTASAANLLNGNTTIGEATFARGLFFQGDVNTPQITSDQNNYDPVEGTNAVWRLWSDAERNITGIATAFNPFSSDGRVVMLMNTGAFNIVLVDESAGSADTNRFAIPGNITIGPEESAMLHYDVFRTRWRLLALGKASAAGDITGGNANQFTESAGILTLMNGLLITNVQSRGWTNLSGPVRLASTADSVIIDDDVIHNSTVDFNLGFTTFGTQPATSHSPLVIDGSFNLSPITNATSTISRVTNAYVLHVLAGHTTFTFGGTALNGARGQADLVNQTATNITITWPLSYSVPQAAGITTFTAYSNSTTEVYWSTVGGSNRVRVAGKEIVENFLNPTAGQLVGFHDPWTRTNVNDQVGAGGALIRVQTNTVTVASVTNLNLIITNGHGLGRFVSNNAATGSADMHLFLENAGIPSSKLQATTGTGGPVLSNAPTINTPTLLVPVIADFSSAQHTHQSAAQGGALDAAAIASGTIATARLGSGTANSSTFLRGDQTYATPAGGGDATLAGAQTFTGPKTFSAAMTNTANHWILGTEGIGLFVGDESGATNFFGAQAFGPVVGQALNLTMGGTDWLLFNGSTDTIIPGVSNNITAGSSTKSLSNLFIGKITLVTSGAEANPPANTALIRFTNGVVVVHKSDGTIVNLEATGAGDVVGPAVANNLAIAVYNGTTGKLLGVSGITLNDTSMSGLSDLTATTLNAITLNATGLRVGGIFSTNAVTNAANSYVGLEVLASSAQITNNITYHSANLIPTGNATNFQADYTFAWRTILMTNAVRFTGVVNTAAANLNKAYIAKLRNTSGGALRVSVDAGFRRSGTNDVSVANNQNADVLITPDGTGGVNPTNHTAQIIIYDSP